MTARDTAELAAQLEQQMVAQYRLTIQAQLKLYGCTRSATGPDTESASYLQFKARLDAQSITDTYNRELTNEVNRLWAANRRGNRFYWFKNLEAWNTKRNAHKLDSIALNTMTAARKYAQDRFVDMNNIQGRWRLVGPPAVCRICVALFALGVVSLETTRKRPAPAHVNCPHTWAQVIPKKFDDCSEVWTG